MELVKFEVEYHGPVATHNYPCPVCWKKHAVLTTNTGVFSPCWDCQGEGWKTMRPSRIERLWRWIRGVRYDTRNVPE